MACKRLIATRVLWRQSCQSEDVPAVQWCLPLSSSMLEYLPGCTTDVEYWTIHKATT